MRVSSLLTPWRVRVYPWIVLAAIGVGWGTVLLTAQGIITSSNWPIGGDFFGLYGVSGMIPRGQGSALLSFVAQQQAEAAIVGGWLGNQLLLLPYPPAYLLLFSPLSFLPFKLAYLTLVGFQVTAVGLMGRMLQPHISILRGEWKTASAVALTFFPLTMAILGSLTTALGLLCLAGVYVALRGQRMSIAGVWLGFLLLKPQLALPFVGLLLIARQWKSLAACGVTAIGLYIVSSLISGWTWPLDWLNLMRIFQGFEVKANDAGLISLIGIFERIFGPGSLAAQGLGGALASVTALALIWAWRGADPGDDSFPLLFGATIGAVLLVGFHVQWYDAGLLFLSFLFLADRYRWQAAPALALLWALAPLGALGHYVPVQPLFFWPVITLGWSLWEWQKSSRAPLPLANAHKARAKASP